MDKLNQFKISRRATSVDTCCEKSDRFLGDSFFSTSRMGKLNQFKISQRATSLEQNSSVGGALGLLSSVIQHHRSDCQIMGIFPLK